MHLGLQILVCSLLASIGVTGITFLFFRRRSISSESPNSVILSFAVGTLLASALLGMLPAALQNGPVDLVMATVLGGILFFFVLEKGLVWRHCHRLSCPVHSVSGQLILIGDAFHNFVDGVMIATAFLAAPATGLAVTLATAAHEIPQEIGDFAILLHSGYSRLGAFLLNTLSASTTLAGALLGYVTLSRTHSLLPYVLAVGASSFLYIGTADLIPGLQKESRPRTAISQFACLLLGVGVIALLRSVSAEGRLQ